MTPTWAVIPTKGRVDLMAKLTEALAPQVMGIVVVNNGDSLDSLTLAQMPGVRVCRYIDQYPPNLSQLINAGIVCAERLASGCTEWNLAFLNDDVLPPGGWVDSLDGPLRSTSAVLAYTDRIGRGEPVLMQTYPRSPNDSMTGWACMVRGELALRWDEDLKWWYSDTMLDWQCRDLGGVIAVPGEIPQHYHPSAQTFADPVLAAQTETDRATFHRKWGLERY